MKIYYVGSLYRSCDVYYSDISIHYCKGFFDDTISSFRSKLTDKEYAKLKTVSKWKNIHDGITDPELQKILDKILVYRIDNWNFKEKIIFEIIEDKNGNFYGKEIITGLLFPLIKEPISSKYTYIVNNNGYINKFNTHIDENLARIGCILVMNEVATANYIKNYNLANDKKNNVNFVRKITESYYENVFKKEIIEKIKEPTLEQNELTKILEQIEYLLCLLKQHNKEKYTEYENLYNDLFVNKDKKFINFSKQIYKNPTRNELLDLLSNIKLSLIINEKNCNNIIEYINIVIEDYLNKLFNNNIQVTDINISDLDNLTGMFLKNEDEYNLQQQRNVLRKLSLLYLLVTKQNIDSLTEEQLENSYFKDNLRSLILNINILHELGILKKPVIVCGDDILTIPYVLDLIKNMEFNEIDNENIKKLVK